MSPTLIFFLPILLVLLPNVYCYSSYANDFIDPDYVLRGKYPNTTWRAQVTIVQWANDAAESGPWSVVNKSITPPSGDLHDYMSWAPYWWPNCTGVRNTTELTPNQVWARCPYYSRDGLFNPDVRLVNDVGAFQNLSDAVLYNSISWALKGDPSNLYSKRVVQYLDTWFLNPATKMNPNLNYGQMERGPNGHNGTHTGVLDLKGFAKIATAILLLRHGKSPDWTLQIDQQMTSWCSEYITWLETAPIALEEGRAENNHGSFYYNQLASLKIITGDLDGAKNVTDTFFDSQFQEQITADGEQPLEAARTRPYHYHAYNLAALITNARLQKYASPSSASFNRTTAQGATIQTALDFAMTLNPGTSKENNYADELYPIVAAVGATYGDPSEKYASYLARKDAEYASEAYFFWNQPLAGGTSGSFNANDPDPNETGTNDDPNTNSPNRNKAQSDDSNSGSVSRPYHLVGMTAVAIGLFIAG